MRKVLLILKSQKYSQYEHVKEEDILIQILNREEISDYREIDWRWFGGLIVDYDTGVYERGRYKSKALEKFINRISPRAEQVRILTFLRDYCRQYLFEGADYWEFYIRDFETECARLISQCIEESKQDEYSGVYLDWPQPNLERIAQGNPFRPQMSEEDKIIIKYLPSYPHNTGGFYPEIVVFVAHEFFNAFMEKAAVFQGTGDKNTMPNMSQATYIDPIRYRLMQLADRYMYFDKEPAYQTLWVMGVLLKISPKKYWCRKKFAEGITAYLKTTKDFANTNHQMEYAVAEIVQKTQPQLPFDGVEERNKPSTKHPTRYGNKMIVEQLAEVLQAKIPEAIDIPKQPIILAQFIRADHVEIETNNGQINSIKDSDVTYNS